MKSPRQATTFNQICSLQSDNKSTKRFWILIDENGGVYIHEQQNGEKSVQQIRIPRRDFNALIDWYNKEQKTRFNK